MHVPMFTHAFFLYGAGLSSTLHKQAYGGSAFPGARVPKFWGGIPPTLFPGIRELFRRPSSQVPKFGT